MGAVWPHHHNLWEQASLTKRQNAGCLKGLHVFSKWDVRSSEMRQHAVALRGTLSCLEEKKTTKYSNVTWCHLRQLVLCMWWEMCVCKGICILARETLTGFSHYSEKVLMKSHKGFLDQRSRTGTGTRFVRWEPVRAHTRDFMTAEPEETSCMRVVLCDTGNWMPLQGSSAIRGLYEQGDRIRSETSTMTTSDAITLHSWEMLPAYWRECTHMEDELLGRRWLW